MPKQLFCRHYQYNYTPSRSTSATTDVLAIGFEPSTPNSPEYGNIYLVFESSPSDHRINTDHLIHSCGKAFYESGLETSFEKRFKLCLRALNELITDAKTTCNLGIVATQAEKLLFAATGDIFMIHGRQSKLTILGDHQKERLFREIGTGNLRINDKLLIASRAVSASFTHKELKKLMTDYPLGKMDEILRSQLEVPEQASAGYVLIGAEALPAEAGINDQPAKKQKLPNPKEVVGSLTYLGRRLTRKTKETKQKVHHSAKAASTRIVPEVSTKTKQGWTTFWAKYVNPNPKQAIIVVIITIIIIGLLIWGINSLFTNSGNTAARKLDDAALLINSAESSLEKGNRSSAQEAANKASQLLEAISASEQAKLNAMAQEKKIKLSYETARQKLQIIADKLTSTTRLDERSSYQTNQAQISALTWTGEKLFGLNPEQGSIIEINPLLGEPRRLSTNPDLVGAGVMQPLNGGGVVLLGKSNLWQYTTATGLQQLKAASLPVTVDVSSYLNNIYLLSPQENQVIRYAKSNTNLSARTALLKNISSGTLANSTSLAVSGNVFIASGREIKLFEAGSERTYEVNELPESYGEFYKLIYNPEQGYFMILNKSKTRIALLSTEADSARFIRQYALNNNSSIQSFTIEPSNSQLILFSEGKIITHKIEK